MAESNGAVARRVRILPVNVWPASSTHPQLRRQQLCCKLIPLPEGRRHPGHLHFPPDPSPRLSRPPWFTKAKQQRSLENNSSGCVHPLHKLSAPPKISPALDQAPNT